MAMSGLGSHLIVAMLKHSSVLNCSVPTHWQGCSKAGLKKGMLDPRSSLCKEIFRIWDSSKSLIQGCNEIRSSQHISRLCLGNMV